MVALLHRQVLLAVVVPRQVLLAVLVVVVMEATHLRGLLVQASHQVPPNLLLDMEVMAAEHLNR